MTLDELDREALREAASAATTAMKGKEAPDMPQTPPPGPKGTLAPAVDVTPEPTPAIPTLTLHETRLTRAAAMRGLPTGRSEFSLTLDLRGDARGEPWFSAMAPRVSAKVMERGRALIAEMKDCPELARVRELREQMVRIRELAANARTEAEKLLQQSTDMIARGEDPKKEESRASQLITRANLLERRLALIAGSGDSRAGMLPVAEAAAREMVSSKLQVLQAEMEREAEARISDFAERVAAFMGENLEAYAEASALREVVQSNPFLRHVDNAPLCSAFGSLAAQALVVQV
jgi:hypothetical protein